MKNILYALAIFGPVLFALAACNDPTVIGSELLEQDEANLRFTDTLTIHTRTVKEDSVLTYTIDNQFNRFPCGYFDDPVFGTLRAEIYAQFKEAALDPPAFEDPVLDSLVLTLSYDTNRVYGVFDETYEIEVRRLTEDLNNDEVFYSNQQFDTEADVLGSLSFTPQPFVKKQFIQRINGDTLEANIISIRLDDDLGNEMLNDAWYTDGAFIEMMKGLEIKIVNSNPTRGLLSFNMNSIFTRLRLFYRNRTTEPDTVAAVYDFGVPGTTTPRMVYLDHDFSGAPVESFFNDFAKGDSLLFLQAMAGPNVEIEIPHFFSLGDIIVNKAEMEFYVATLPEDDATVYTPLDQLIVAVRADDGIEEFFLIDDVGLSGTGFGGTLSEVEVNGTTMQKYTVNMAAYLNRKLIEGATGGINLFLRAFPKQESTKRVVLYGAGHSQYPVKFRMTYTEINE